LIVAKPVLDHHFSCEKLLCGEIAVVSGFVEIWAFPSPQKRLSQQMPQAARLYQNFLGLPTKKTVSVFYEPHSTPFL
jgi:hypothetical protein